jgi:putative ABC transport system permease protein
MSAVAIAVFASLALLLAAIGGYGVMSYSVAQRTREIGIRMALGARQSDVMRLVVRQGMLLALAGIAAGLGASLALARFLQSMLFGIDAADPVTLLSASGVLCLAALIASFIPARRASLADPMTAVRHE